MTEPTLPMPTDPWVEDSATEPITPVEPGQAVRPVSPPPPPAPPPPPVSQAPPPPVSQAPPTREDARPLSPPGPVAVPPPGAVPPAAALLPMSSEPVVARVGEIEVTSSTIRTPAGEFPLRGSTWQVSDQWLTEQKTPTWAIITAIVGFCVLTIFSLLFLLVKKTIYRGTVQVTVTNGPQQYVARIPVAEQSEVQYLHQQVNYVRSLAAL